MTMVPNYYEVTTRRADQPRALPQKIAQFGDNPRDAERRACARQAAFYLGGEEYAHLWTAECHGLVYP